MTNKSEEQSFMTNRELIRDMHTKVNRVYEIVIGDPDANRPGLAHDVEKLKEKERNRSKVFVFVSSISSGLAITLVKFIDWLQGLGHHN